MGNGLHSHFVPPTSSSGSTSTNVILNEAKRSEGSHDVTPMVTPNRFFASLIRTQRKPLRPRERLCFMNNRESAPQSLIENELISLLHLIFMNATPSSYLSRHPFSEPGAHHPDNNIMPSGGVPLKNRNCARPRLASSYTRRISRLASVCGVQLHSTHRE